MSGGAVITFRKELMPGQRYLLRFVLAGADHVWSYMRFDFQREDGTLCAAGYMKGAAARRAGLVPNPESYARLGHAFESLPLPIAIDHWLAAERAAIDGRADLVRGDCV